MNASNFETPLRQSKKGVIVIFGLNIYKAVKQSLIVLSIFFLRYLTSDNKLSSVNNYVYLGIGLVVLYLFIHALLKYLNFKFQVLDDYFILNHGILNKEKTSVSKSKIQNVYIKQNLIQQLINVVSLSIETAGDDKTEIEIQALSLDQANALKKLLLQNRVVNTSLKDQEVTETTSVYYRVSIKKLLLEGVSENHFKSFLFILFFLFGVYNDLKDFLQSLEIKSKFDQYLNLNETEFFSLILFNFILVFLLLILAFLFSLIKTVVENFDLTVLNKNEGLEISKGLFNKISLGLIPSRIQNTTIKTNRFKKALGLHKLVFTQAMVNKKQQKNFNIIGLSQIQVNELINRFYPNCVSNIEKRKPEPYFILRSSINFILLLLLLNLIFYFLPNSFYFINIPILIVSFLSVYYGFKKTYYSIDNNYLVIGGGKFIETHTSFLELHKIQAVTLQQTVFQKRKQLASVEIFSASDKLMIPHIKVETAKQIVDYLLFKVESSPKDWM